MRRDLHRRLRAWCLLATFVCALGSSQLNADHSGIIDVACGDVAMVESEGSRVGVALDGAAEHCPVCHFMRTVNSATVSTVAPVGVLQRQALLEVAVSPARPTIETLTRLSRGPPIGIQPSVSFF